MERTAGASARDSGRAQVRQDKLAKIIEKTVAKKEDLSVLATKVDILDQRMNGLDNKLDALEHAMTENFRLVREEIKMVNFAVEIDDLRERMKRVEQELGL